MRMWVCIMAASKEFPCKTYSESTYYWNAVNARNWKNWRNRRIAVSAILVREYIMAGLREDNSQALSTRVLKRRKGKPVTNAVKVLEQIREERVNELLGRRR